MAMKHYEPGKPYHRPGQKKKKKNLRPLLALLALLVVIGLAAGLVFAWLNRHKAQVPEDVSPAATEAPAAPTATPEPTAEPTPEPTAEPLTFSWDTTGEEGNPYLIAVNRTTQTVTVYEKDDEGNYTVPFKSMICSTGRDTPVGFFHTSNQYDWRALVGGVYGQYATRISPTEGILFHSVPYYSAEKDQLETEEFNKLGTPASLGCVRLQIEDCKWIYDECPSGSPVVIYDGDESTDPLGNPGFTPIDVNSPNAGWDPTDPDPANPWNS